MEKELAQALDNLLEFLDKEGVEGYDPYDALNSPFLSRMKSKWFRIAATVFFRLAPINIRKIFRIPKGINPKGMGILLSAYATIARSGKRLDTEKAGEIFDWLCNNASEGYSGLCWGYNFPWQDRIRLLDRGIPTIVNTSFIGHGILDYYDIQKSQKSLDAARSACDFILKDLNIRETDQGICFSYNPVEENIVHNANVLGASLLARVYAHTREDELLDFAKRAFAFTLHHQHENGSWAHNMSPETGRERFQLDWHQGFILDCLMWFLEATVPSDEVYRKALASGAQFYKTQFTEEGIAYWRYPRRWPIDIHNQAQGIITFSKLEKYFPGSLQTAEKILRWTLANLKNKKKGSFHYEKWPLFTNKISYTRWGQAWMLLALATYLSHIDE
jgi:rhamnogalacturonyl hydrolase YesR